MGAGGRYCSGTSHWRRSGETMGNVANDVHLGGDNPAGVNHLLFEPTHQSSFQPKAQPRALQKLVPRMPPESSPLEGTTEAALGERGPAEGRWRIDEHTLGPGRERDVLAAWVKCV